MSDDKGQIEEYAKSENDWVRARVIKQNPPPEGSLLQIAERARDMAANSLGTQHWAYALALLNLGIYYDFIEHNTAKAQEFIDQASAIVEESKTGSALYADALFQLGTARKERNLPTDDPRITEGHLNQALFIHRRLSAERLLANETVASGPWMDHLDEACAIALFRLRFRFYGSYQRPSISTMLACRIGRSAGSSPPEKSAALRDFGRAMTAVGQSRRRRL